jgi:hypothetical protein
MNKQSKIQLLRYSNKVLNFQYVVSLNFSAVIVKFIQANRTLVLNLDTSLLLSLEI